MKIAVSTGRTPYGYIRAGQVYADDDDVVRAYPDLFCAPDDYAEHEMPRELVVGVGDQFARPVEQATADPGTTRPTTRKKAAKKAAKKSD